MRVLIVTKIFPSSVEPALAPYNRHQFGRLGRLCDVELLALVPWLPGAGWLSATAKKRSRVPPRERIDELTVHHPRVLYAPRAGRPLSGALYAASLLPRVWPMRGKVDVVLGSFAYPDGWAAVALSQLLGAAVVIKIHGSDVNVYEQDWLLRPNLRWALSRASAVVAPSQPLIDKAVALGADTDRATVVHNGVDRTLFRLRERRASRAAIGRINDKRWLLFVGRLEPAKGVDELLEAFSQLTLSHPDVELVLLGDGVGRETYRALVEQRQLPVHFAGERPPQEVALWLGAADALVLPSHNEGTPNVILEAHACGRRVVATRVGGIPAVVDDPLLGELVPPRAPDPLAGALSRVLAADWQPQAIADRARIGSWDDSARALHTVLQRAVQARRRRI